MCEFLVALLAKAAMALAEAIVARVVWELWATYAPSRRAAAAA
jgi:hypothetical protein